MVLLQFYGVPHILEKKAQVQILAEAMDDVEKEVYCFSERKLKVVSYYSLHTPKQTKKKAET
jgi:hypothetical protein